MSDIFYKQLHQMATEQSSNEVIFSISFPQLRQWKLGMQFN